MRKITNSLATVFAVLFFSACGGGGGGSDSPSSSPAEYGNYMFLNATIWGARSNALSGSPEECWTGAGVRCYSITGDMNQDTSEQTPIYIGNASTPNNEDNTLVAMAWYPSLNSYLLVEADENGIDFYQWYQFTIEPSDRLNGKMCSHTSLGDSCSDLSSKSIKTDSGKWIAPSARISSQSERIVINLLEKIRRHY